MEYDADCCRFTVTTGKKGHNSRVARHRSLQFNKEKLRKRVTDQHAHIPPETHNVEPSTRSEGAKEHRGNRGRRGDEIKKGPTSTCARSPFKTTC